MPSLPVPNTAQPELVGFGHVNPVLVSWPGYVKKRADAPTDWGDIAHSSRVIRSPTDTWNGFSFTCPNPASSYKVVALSSATKGTHMNSGPRTSGGHGSFEYGFTCRPNGLVTFLTPQECHPQGNHAKTDDGSITTSATADDVFSVKFNSDGVLEYRKNGIKSSPTCATLSGSFPQPTVFPLYLMVDLYKAGDAVQGVTWLPATDP